MGTRDAAGGRARLLALAAGQPIRRRIEVSAAPEVEQFLRVGSSDTCECAAAFADSGSMLERWTATEPWLLAHRRGVLKTTFAYTNR